MEIFIYLLKIAGCMAAFYIVYYTLLRKLTFFSLNRWYLLSALVSSLVIPALHIGVQTLIPAPNVTPIAINTTTKTIQDVADPVITAQVASHINWLFAANCAYALIASLLLLKLIVNLCGIMYKAIKHGERQNNYLVVKGNTASNSSFFKYIFLNENNLNDTEKEQVIAHELVHVKRLHSVDNLFTEVLKTLLWFNPFIYLYAKALHQVHEFEVDGYLANQYNSKNYAGLLLKLSLPASVGLVNQFSAYGLKSRIGMLFSKPSAVAKKLSYLLALPIIAALVYFLAIEKVYAYDESNKNFVLILDAGHGGKQKGIDVDGILEKDLNLTIVKQIKAIAEQRGIKTILTRTDDSNIPLKSRLIPQGDVFVSVHVNGTSAQTTDNSGMLVLTNKNANYVQSQQLAQTFIDEMKQLSGLGINDRDNSDQNILVLRENKAPAILLELGYMNNKSDLKFLLDKQNQHTIAERFVNAVIAYKKLLKPKVSGAVTLPDTTKQAKAKQPDTKIAGTHLADTAKQAQTKQPVTKIAGSGKYWADTALRMDDKNKITGHATKMTISKTVDEDDIANGKAKDNLYDEFKHAQYTSYGSKIVNVTKDEISVYDAKVLTQSFNITANYIKMNVKDSVLVAGGKVHVKFMSGIKPTDTHTTVDVDTLTIDMKFHFKKKEMSKG